MNEPRNLYLTRQIQTRVSQVIAIIGEGLEDISEKKETSKICINIRYPILRVPAHDSDRRLPLLLKQLPL